MGDDTIKPPSDSWQLVPPGWTLVPPGGVRPTALPPPPRASWSPSPQDAYIEQLEAAIVVLKRSAPDIVVIHAQTRRVLRVVEARLDPYAKTLTVEVD